MARTMILLALQESAELRSLLQRLFPIEPEH
jgi:hypothetical protein